MAVSSDLILWRAVLLIGLHDAAAGRDTAWLGSDDFAMVCDLAGLDPQTVLRCYQPERLVVLPRARAA